MRSRPNLSRLTNVIGDRGEKIFELALTDYRAFNRPLFRPCFLGEKWPTIDYYVELLNVRGSTPYFFVQVKSTAIAMPPNANNIQVQATRAQCLNLYKYPGPTYIAGVHEPSKKVFITSVHVSPVTGVSAIPVAYELTPTNLQSLYDEVLAYWRAQAHKPNTSRFL